MLSNADIAELLALQATTARMPVKKALTRASRLAFLWPEEVADLVDKHVSLTELPGIGPYLAKQITRWIEDPPEQLAEPAEIRRHFLTRTQVRKELAKNPSCLKNVKGDLQMHTEWSDGATSIREMAETGIEQGYEYVAITDHSKGLRIAGGMDERQLTRQADEIIDLNNQLHKEHPEFKILRSIELNLNVQGEGDMDSGTLGYLDVVLGCFHSSLRTKNDQTQRYLAALRNPDIQILGHPRGRVYNYRLGLSADWQQVFDLAKELDKAVEIDGYPDRQDLSIDLLQIAKKSGCRISFGTDAHGPSEMRFMEYSAAAALLAGIDKNRILNFLSREDLLAWATSVRETNAN